MHAPALPIDRTDAIRVEEPAVADCINPATRPRCVLFSRMFPEMSRSTSGWAMIVALAFSIVANTSSLDVSAPSIPAKLISGMIAWAFAWAEVCYVWTKSVDMRGRWAVLTLNDCPGVALRASPRLTAIW